MYYKDQINQLINENKAKDNKDYLYYEALKCFYGWDEKYERDCAKKLYELGMEYENPKCLYALAIMSDDELIQNDLFVKAFGSLLKEAEDGDPESQRMVSCYYLTDKRGVSKDMDIAIDWLKKSAEQNNPVAIFNLAGCYMKGEAVEKDSERGMELLRKSAEAGYEKAVNMLSKM